MKEVTKVRGTLDKLEKDTKIESTIIDKISRWLSLCNFNKIQTPILEKTDLFIESIGQATDIVNKELFFIQNRSESDEKICLRPELTAGVFRAYLENKSHIISPWKVFTIGPCFRYERPQKGRWRQFDQVSIEIIDSKSEMFDAELVLNLDRFFSHQLNLTNYFLKINYIGNHEERKKFREALLVFLNDHESSLCKDCNVRKTTNILRCLDCKNGICQKVLELAPKILGYLDEESLKIFETIKENLTFNSVNFSVDQMLVRGLDYYQGLVFEFVSGSIGAQNTFCGGGRYELALRLGSKNAIPSIGAGIGLGRLSMILEEEDLIKIIPDKLVAILPLSKDQESLGLIVSDFLRKNNQRCELVVGIDSVKSKIKQAVKLGAVKAIFIGETEVLENILTVKDLITGIEVKVSQSKVLEAI